METAKKQYKPYNKMNGKKPNTVNKKPFNNKKGGKPNGKPSGKTSIKKRVGLQYVDMATLPDKRMYRISIIFGSTTIADTFIVDKPYIESMVTFRDKLLESYQDLLKLLDKEVVEKMLLKPYTKELPNDIEGIVSGKNTDIVHRIVQELYTASDDQSSLFFPTIVNAAINPGCQLKGVTKRLMVRLNYVKNPNFAPKKAVKENKSQPKKAKPRKITVVKKNK